LAVQLFRTRSKQKLLRLKPTRTSPLHRHRTVSTTLDLYSHVTETMPHEAARQIGGIFRALLSTGTSA
jgi:hypothetical protein